MELKLGQTIKSLRRKRGVSQEDLAAALGVTMQAVSKWETEKANPDLFLVPKLAEYFGVSTEVFFYGLETEQETMPEDAAQLLEKNSVLEQHGYLPRLTVSPMEIDPGLPRRHFDLVYSIYGLGWSMDLEKTFACIAGYLKPGGRLVFSWDNPLMQCVDAEQGGYRLARSYVEEREIAIQKVGNSLFLRNWKLSAYLNCLAEQGFLIERVVEESAYDPEDAQTFLEGKYYSAGKARLLNPTFIVMARKL